MLRLSNLLKKKLVFIGGDGWGTWGDSEVGRALSKYPMKAYHITPWSLDLDTERTNYFKKQYYKFYHKKPINKLSFIIYETTNSIVESVIELPTNCKQIRDISKRIMCSYKTKVAQKPNWYKPDGYAVFKMENKSNHLFSVIN